MEEQLVSFKTAKMAKEKGFDIKSQCQSMYNPYARLRTYSQIDWSHIGDFVLAPTQSLLQKWLREVHNIHIKINITTQETYFYGILQFLEHAKNSQNPAVIGYQNVASSEKVKTYEEALEVGLQEALKLI